KKQLFSILRGSIPEPGEDTIYDDVWDCYNGLNQDQRDWETLVAVTNFFSFSIRQQDKVRILLLVESEAPTDYLFWKNIVLSLYLDRIERAFALQSQSAALGE